MKGPSAIVMCGFPASGKSSYIKMFIPDKYTVIDFDSVIEWYAKRDNITYSQAFQKYKKPAFMTFYRDIKNAARRGTDLVIDCTSLSIASRKHKIRLIKEIDEAYHMTCIHIEGDHISSYERSVKREPFTNGKVIDRSVFWDMHLTYQEPSLEEGFDIVKRIRQNV